MEGRIDLQGMFRLFIDDYRGTVPRRGGDAGPSHSLMGCDDFNIQPRRGQYPPSEGGARDRLLVIGQEETARGLVLVLGQPGATYKLGGVFPIRLTGSKEGTPVLVELAQDVIRNLARQGRIGVRMLDEMEECSVTQIAALKDEGLPYQIIRRVVEVLGSKGSGVNHGKAAVAAADDVLFNQLHRCPPRPLSLLHNRHCLPS